MEDTVKEVQARVLKPKGVRGWWDLSPRCSNCGGKVSWHDNFCSHCAAQFIRDGCSVCKRVPYGWQHMKYCPDCGNDLVPSVMERQEKPGK